MDFEVWWNETGRHTSNHRGIARRAWEAALKDAGPMAIVQSNKPCSYCTGSLDQTRCESCDALTMDCFVGRILSIVL